jgi:sec-independent protein translocase protein TatA
MGDVAKGIKNFKSGLKDEDETTTPPAAVTSASPTAATNDDRSGSRAV